MADLSPGGGKLFGQMRGQDARGRHGDGLVGWLECEVGGVERTGRVRGSWRSANVAGVEGQCVCI